MFENVNFDFDFRSVRNVNLSIIIIINFFQLKLSV